MRNIADLIFSQIDAGHDFGIPGHPDEWREPIVHLPAKQLIERSMAEELAIAETFLERIFHDEQN